MSETRKLRKTRGGVAMATLSTFLEDDEVAAKKEPLNMALFRRRSIALHYSASNLEDVSIATLAQKLCDELDPFHVFFLEEDRGSLESLLRNQLYAANNNDCSLIEKIYNELYLVRVKDQENYIQSIKTSIEDPKPISFQKMHEAFPRLKKNPGLRPLDGTVEGVV